MEQFHKTSSRIVVLLSIIWAGFAVVMPVEQLGFAYMGFGVLVLYIGIQNMILYKWGEKTGTMPKKIQVLIEKHGTERGTIFFVVFFILIFIMVGLGVIYSGYQIQFHNGLL